MTVHIKALTPELTVTFSDYLGNLDFGHAPHWATCFCRFYQNDGSFEEWQGRTGPDNRAEAEREIATGNMKGYMAFDGDKCIGWCNANDAKAYCRLQEHIGPVIKDQKVGCVICFVIHPEYRKQGIARLLLKQAIEDFKTEGFSAVLALPVQSVETPEKMYRGSLNMYTEQGFKEIEKHDEVHVMWLKL
ncbi:MAG: GNAT family N-acetyltransferase [Vallitaleaceae bacterium]|nr:GNAT family N-acetyltransferase [Vallitaleaceae bacterium]